MSVERVISGIQNGYGSDADYYKVGSNSVTKIVRSRKPVEFGEGHTLKEIEVYRVFSNKGVICELESNCGITLYFYLSGG